jgi:hypothetical protein
MLRLAMSICLCTALGVIMAVCVVVGAAVFTW